jgi:D-amino-acid dehydrogenase
MNHVIVIGAGVVGAATALALTERGHRVTVIDRASGVAAATSQANGGGITPLHSEPWNQPGLFGNLLRYMGRPDAPWRLPPSSLPGIGFWGLRFMLEARRPRFEYNARATIRLGCYSLEVLQHWREAHELHYDQTCSGSMQLYFSEAALSRSFALRQRLIEGVGEVERLDANAVVAREPALAQVRQRLAGALYYPAHESGDAAAFARQVIARATAAGAELRLNEGVQRIDCEGGEFHAVVTDRNTIEADACVIATGSETPALLQSLSVKAPIYPVRGYSATFELEDARDLPTLPLLDAERRFVTLRLGDRKLRVAGLADFSGHRRAVPPARMDTLLASARQLLPALSEQLTPKAGRLWAGLRPVTPDGRPLIGETDLRGLYLNTGHGPMGWTMACGSAQILADLVDGREPALDVSDYRADRFGRRAA